MLAQCENIHSGFVRRFVWHLLEKWKWNRVIKGASNPSMTHKSVLSQAGSMVVTDVVEAIEAFATCVGSQTYCTTRVSAMAARTAFAGSLSAAVTDPTRMFRALGHPKLASA